MGFFKFITSGRLLHKRFNQYRILIRTKSDGGPSSPCTETPASCGAGDGSSQEQGKKKGLVIGVHEKNGTFELTGPAQEIDQMSNGKLAQHLSELSGDMKLGKAFVLSDLVPEYSTVALASVGPADAGFNKLEELDEGRENIRWGVGAGAAAALAQGARVVAVAAPAHHDAAAEAATLAAFGFKNFKQQKRKDTVVPFGNVDMELWTAGRRRARAQNWARYLSDMPANKMTPSDFAQAAFDVLCPLGVKVTARNRAWIEANKMEAFLMVARGSCEEPILLECEYNGGGSQSNVLVVAKGVTFDSGGLCLKNRSDMKENRGSMAGAAVTLAAIRALAEAKERVNVCAVIPLCENMISGQCMKVGDVVRALNGLSIQIEDTDMEGRLMMADALVYGQNVYKPGLVVNVATLTKGVLLAMGGGAFGSFSTSGRVWGALRGAGACAGDRPWRLPLWNYYRDQITQDMAVDLRNRGSGKATPCIGAAFLRQFVCGPWLHLDITGVGKLSHAPAPPYLDPRRMSGRPTRTLTQFLAELRNLEKEEEPCKPCN